MFVIIVGGGKMGGYLASLLLNSGKKVRVIEELQDRLAALQRDLPPEAVVHGSGADPYVLEAAGIRQADVLAAVTDADETNLVAAGLARSEFKVGRVIARINDPHNAWLFTPKMGVDVALNQADLLAHMILEEMSLGEMSTLLKLRRGEYSLVEEKVHPQSRAAGCMLARLGLPEESVVAAVIRQGRLMIPNGSLVLEAGDEVLAVVHASALARLADILGNQSGPTGSS